MEPQMTVETLLIEVMQAFPHRGANCNTLDPFITRMKDRFVPEYHKLITLGLLSIPSQAEPQEPVPAEAATTAVETSEEE